MGAGDLAGPSREALNVRFDPMNRPDDALYWGILIGWIAANLTWWGIVERAF